MNYQVADFVIRIKNASLARRRRVNMPFSNISKAIGKLLVKEGFLEDIKEETAEGRKILTAKIKYEKRSPVMTDVKVISKPSLRIYAKAVDTAKKKKRGFGTTVLSTSQGLMTQKDARKKGIGGEVLFRIS